MVVIRIEDSVNSFACPLLLMASAAEIAGTILMEMEVMMDGGKLNSDIA